MAKYHVQSHGEASWGCRCSHEQLERNGRCTPSVLENPAKSRRLRESMYEEEKAAETWRAEERDRCRVGVEFEWGNGVLQRESVAVFGVVPWGS
jgi:hypothetical protein